jgi:thiol-disulfide isomerase/thioredoxin
MKIEFISAPWCKACHKIKPDFIQHCMNLGIEPILVNYDELDDSEYKDSIKHLPTIRMNVDGTWKTYVASQFEEWRFATVVAGLNEISEF